MDEKPSTSSASSDIVVFIIQKNSICSECGEELFPGDFLRLEKEKPLCLDCADLGHLEFLPRGDAALTRRASKHSTLRAVVVQWSKSRKRYERQGIFVEPDAIAQAEAECAADAPQRAQHRAKAAVHRDAADRQFIVDFAKTIRDEFPGCSTEDANSLATHACEKHSGRVGRSAAAKTFDADAVRLAVIAHIRHVHTNYDDLLASGRDRHEARGAVAGKISQVVERWRSSR